MYSGHPGPASVAGKNPPQRRDDEDADQGYDARIDPEQRQGRDEQATPQRASRGTRRAEPEPAAGDRGVEGNISDEGDGPQDGVDVRWSGHTVYSLELWFQ